MKREEALDAVRVLVANGAQFDTNVPTSTVITWLDHAGYDEEACLRSLGYAAALGWISGGAHFDFIQLTARRSRRSETIYALIIFEGARVPESSVLETKYTAGRTLKWLPHSPESAFGNVSRRIQEITIDGRRKVISGTAERLRRTRTSESPLTTPGPRKGPRPAKDQPS
jgi:hypothetical protein